MKNFLLCLFLTLFFLFPASAAETDESEKDESFFHFGDFKIKKAGISPEIESLNFSADIAPLEKDMAEDEKAEEKNSGFEQIREPDKMPEIACNLPQLKKQVEDFVYKNLTADPTSSVIEKRRRILAVRNLHDFEDMTEEKIDAKKDFSAAAAITYLRINENRQISRICRSSGNKDNEKLERLYAVIYPYTSYYKVVVPNLMTSVENIGEATFIFNW